MAVEEFKLPDVGEGVHEGELVSWLVSPGDTVTEDQPVAEVETDKALVEVPSPYNGTVKELLAEEGEMVPVGNVIITFDVGGDEAATDAAEVGGDDAATDAAEVGGDDAAADAAEVGESEAATDAAESEPAAGAEAAAESGPEAAESAAEPEEPSTPSGRVFAPPSARRLARELGVDISQVEGSGPGGRVTDADVRAHAEAAGNGEVAEAEPEAPAEESAAETGPAETDASAAETTAAAEAAAERDRTLAAPATRRLAEELGVDLDAVPTDETREGEAFVGTEQVQAYAEAQQAAQEAESAAVSAAGEAAADAEAEAAPETEPEAAAGVSGERVPYRGVRKTIGDAMVRSKYTAPHVTHFDDVDVSELVELREEYKELAADRGVKLTYMPFIMKAVAAALEEYPYVNAMLDEEAEEIVLRDEYHIGVATDTEAGLMVPVVRDVDQKGLLALGDETRELARKAREREISLSELRGSTFSITNVGAIGGLYGTAIINHPEVAILALGEIREQPRVVDGEVVPRHVLTLALSFDHRVLDGATAARFTNRITELLRNPKLLLLE